jgi:hypothetical protein
LTADIRPGAIVCTYISTINPPKDKLGLIAHIEPDRDSVALFLIHSELPKFIQNNAKLIAGVTSIARQDHAFLDHDSWLRFGDVHSCRYSELLRQIAAKERCFCGYASTELLERLIKLIPLAPDLPPKKQKRYCETLSGLL